MKYKKRLTQWVADGASLILDNPSTAEEARQQVMVQFKKACIKLAELEDKIESGEIDYVSDKDAEIARLTAENAELRARLDKAVELPLVQTIRGNKLPYEVVYKNNNGRIIVTKYRRWQKKQAEARLKELKEENND